jgi:hypothetical protein
MKNKTTTRFDYNESEMADAFQNFMVLNKGIPGLATFNCIYKEVNSVRGRADFIAFAEDPHYFLQNYNYPLDLTCTTILSFLKQKSPRTTRYLLEKTEYSKNSIENSLKFLLANRFIKKANGDSYILYIGSRKFMLDIYAFELKLDNPKRAIFQAQQCKAYASRVIIIAPPTQIKNYYRFSENMKRWGIGLMSFDPITNSFSIVKRPRATSVYSMKQKIFNISRLKLTNNLFS